MTRTLTIVGAAAALAVSAAPGFAASSNRPALSSTESYNLSNTMISGFSVNSASDRFTARRAQRILDNIDARVGGVTDGTSNTIQFAERSASFTIDIGTSEAAHNGNAKPPTRSANLTHVWGGANGIIAVLIGL